MTGQEDYGDVPGFEDPGRRLGAVDSMAEVYVHEDQIDPVVLYDCVDRKFAGADSDDLIPVFSRFFFSTRAIRDWSSTKRRVFLLSSLIAQVP